MPHLSPMNWMMMLFSASTILMFMSSSMWWKQQQKITLKSTKLNLQNNNKWSWL